MKILTYDDMKATVLWKSPLPQDIVKVALNVTMKRKALLELDETLSPALTKFLVTAKHTSLLEHAVICFYLQNVSRSFLAQITRHRICSFTASSQHYQDYRDYPMVVHPDQKDNPMMRAALVEALHRYERLVDAVDARVLPQEARQLLPNASAVHMVWTINARALMNFLNLRCCKRNVDEMRHAAEVIRYEAIEWWPELFECIGPDCFMDKCTQGKMSCGAPYDKETYNTRVLS